MAGTTRAIVFDCFGVLVGQGFGYTYSVAGGDAARDRQFIHSTLREADAGQISHEEFASRIAKHLGISVEKWLEITKQEEQLNAELVQYIATRLKPHYKIGLLSNANSGTIDNRIPAEVLSNLFDSVVVSADVGLLKPDPEVFKYTADDLGVACEEMVFVDDVASYVDAASKLGIKTVLYKNFDQCKSELSKILKPL